MKLAVSLPLLVIGCVILLSGALTWPDPVVAALVRVIVVVACATVWLMSAALGRR
jgi:hypothetical protein